MVVADAIKKKQHNTPKHSLELGISKMVGNTPVGKGNSCTTSIAGRIESGVADTHQATFPDFSQ